MLQKVPEIFVNIAVHHWNNKKGTFYKRKKGSIAS